MEVFFLYLCYIKFFNSFFNFFLFLKEVERKECVFCEFFGKNFYNIFCMCYFDMDGKGWYLLVDENGKVSVEKVFYSDELRFYFIVKMLKDYEVDDGERSEIIFNILNENNKRCDKKIKKDFGFFLFEVVWIL